MGAVGSKFVKKTAEKAVTSQAVKKAVEGGVKDFDKQAEAIWEEIVKKSQLPNQGRVVEKILKENEQNKQAFVDISENLLDSSKENKTSSLLSSGLNDWSDAMEALGGGKSYAEAEKARNEEASTLGRGGK